MSDTLVKKHQQCSLFPLSIYIISFTSLYYPCVKCPKKSLERVSLTVLVLRSINIGVSGRGTLRL
jgi:hypothetical protein